MQGDTSAAIEFLRRFYPDGPWVLVAIDPGRKGIETRTFLVDQIEPMRGWVESWIGVRNLYFSVNPPRRTIDKKLERGDIASLNWLHVDLDPRAGEDLDDERGRILNVLQNKLPTGVPKPTCLVFSGGGYQAFWRLEEPMPLDGSEEAYEQAKRYNLQLEMLFGADSCHNVDRIMRLPGSINIPNALKRKKGRTEVMAELIEWHEDRVYSLDQFTPAPEVQSPNLGFGTNDQIKVDIQGGNVSRLGDIDELDEWGVPDRVKVIAVQGYHPDEPKEGDNSRSVWLFDFVCNCLRAQVPDEVVFSIITDPNFLISASVLETGSNAEKYALKQIRDGKEQVIEPALRDMNARHAVIGNFGGKCLIVEEVKDPTFKGRARLSKQSVGDIKNRYMNRKVQVGKGKDGSPVFMPLGKWWLEHPLRRQYDYLVFSPEKDVPNSYNLWQGFACEARPGSGHSSFLEHIRANVCAGNQDHYEYVIGWLARLIQHPASQGHTALVLRGGQGTGKSFFATMIGSLLGRHSLHISDSSHLVGNFNSHLRDCLLLFADEAFYAGDKKHESKLKTLITEETIAIEAKGVDVESAPNYIHLIMASNQEWVVPAGADERRYCVLNVNEEHKQDAAYFRAISEEMKAGGLENLLNFLLHYDLSGFNVRAVPKTEGLSAQKEYSMSADEEWWFNKLQRGSVEADGDWCDLIPNETLQDDYIRHMKAHNVRQPSNPTILGKFLSRVMPGDWPRVTRRKMKMREFSEDMGSYYEVTKDKVRVYLLPNLTDCRAHWESLFGPQRWQEIPTQGDLDEGDPDNIPF